MKHLVQPGANLKLLPFMVISLFIISSCNRSQLNWYKGNIHTHSFWSDGDDFPERVSRWYHDNNYDFLAITDHNTILEGERWREFPKNHATLKKYLEEYGEDWVELRLHEEKEGVVNVRLKTLDEFRSLYEKPEDFLLIMGNEISNPHAVHLLALHQYDIIPAIKGTVEERERMIRETANNLQSFREESGKNVFPVLAHPNFTWAITAEMMINVPELRYFEVYNGHPRVHNDGDELRASTETIWDIVLTTRLTRGTGEILYGVATDDAHTYHGGNVGPGKGWIMVRSEKLTPDALLDAIDEGNFYASTGIIINDIKFNGRKLDIEIMPQDGIEYTTEFVGSLKGTDISGKVTTDLEGNKIANTTQTYSNEIGKVLATSTSLNPTYTLSGDELYVRARISSSADHIDPNSGTILGKQKAWVQPVIPLEK